MPNENWISYTPKDWVRGEVIKEVHMDHIEEGILNATEKINLLKKAISYEDMKIINFEMDKNEIYPSGENERIKFMWETNNNPSFITIGEIVVPSELLSKIGSVIHSISTPNPSTTSGWSRIITIVATDEGSEGGVKSPTTAQAQITFNYKSKIYYGINTSSNGLTSVQIVNLGGYWDATTSRTRNNISVNATGQNYIWFAFPKRLGTPTFRAGSSSSPAGGFIHNSVWDIAIENENGFTENYTLWRSNNLGLGNTAIWVS